ncbi:MAG: hypothetical protein ACI936_002953, partial [Paraglaciecola sp.]
MLVAFSLQSIKHYSIVKISYSNKLDTPPECNDVIVNEEPLE